MDNSHKSLVLALESGLAGGTVSILRDGSQIDFLAGTESVSRSEDLLALTDELFQKNGLKKSEIGLIAVSVGPGSLTGLRIGLATAMGMAEVLSVEICRMSLLDAMIVLSKGEERVLAVFYVPTEGYYYGRYFQKEDCFQFQGQIEKKERFSEIAAELKLDSDKHTIIFNEVISEDSEEYFNDEIMRTSGKKHCSVKGNPAEILGLAAFKARPIM